jgi:hypothetical protein
MLLSLAFGVIYVIMDHQYRSDERYPIIDLITTIIWTIFWIAGSSAWAQGVSNIRSQTDPGYVIGIVTDCGAIVTCTVDNCKSFKIFFENFSLFILSWYIC